MEYAHFGWHVQALALQQIWSSERYFIHLLEFAGAGSCCSLTEGVRVERVVALLNRRLDDEPLWRGIGSPTLKDLAPRGFCVLVLWRTQSKCTQEWKLKKVVV